MTPLLSGCPSPVVDALNREAGERFAAGYIQCMHDVHTFVSSCPGMEPAVAADLLNQLLERMPLNDELQEMLPETRVNDDDLPACTGAGPRSDGVDGTLSPTPSSTDDLSSDPDETDSEPSQGSSSDEAGCELGPWSRSLWRPWFSES